MATVSANGQQNPNRSGMQAYFTARYIREAPREIGIALLASDEARQAASEWTAELLRWRADARDEDGPLVRGWAIHAAFLAGAKWQAEQEERDGETDP